MIIVASLIIHLVKSKNEIFSPQDGFLSSKHYETTNIKKHKNSGLLIAIFIRFMMKQ